MIIDERTNLDDDADGAPTRALHSSLSHGMWWTTTDRGAASASRFLDWRSRWLWPRFSAASVEAEDVSLGGITSHEAAIARVEQHLHGPHGVMVPADPLCKRLTEL